MLSCCAILLMQTTLEDSASGHLEATTLLVIFGIDRFVEIKHTYNVQPVPHSRQPADT